ncbi:MAG: hypothetical protein ABI076_08000 [Acidobacteriaceae bacterium]
MAKSSRCLMIHLLAFAVLILAPAAWAQKPSPIAEKIAKAYGVDSWGQVDAIRYTWNVQFPGGKVSHSWVWEPKTGQVSYEGNGKDGKPVKVTYQSAHLSSAPANVRDEIQPSFINDQYWLLFPFHAYWDTSATVTNLGMRKLPIGKGSAELVRVKYPAAAGGFTPGDTWDLYVGKGNRVEQFVYRRGGSTKPSVVITNWAGYKKAGPILISTEHRGTADGKPLHLFLSNVAVKLTGSDTWIPAQ